MERDDDAPTIDERGPGAPIRASEKRYTIGGQIGRGGVGEVLDARDEQIGRDVAVKRLKNRLPDELAVQRFLREAQIQGRLQHPAIPPVHELGRDSEGLPFFVMKKLTGTTLAQILHGGKREPQHTRQRLLRAFADVCLAIEFAHVRGVIHRDIKPANIMLGAFGEVYVLDWGIAKVLGESELADVVDRRHPTAIGAIVGTPKYMSPEQVEGADDLDARADVYSLGYVLDEILEADPDIPPELARVAEQATAIDRAARIATARELGERVQRYLDGDRDLELRRSLARGHLQNARRAFDADDRRTAMREAGRAIALDPQLAGAAELLGRLMIEPPREMPPEVQAAIAKHDIDTNTRQAKAGARLYIAYFAFIPFLIGYRGGSWFVILFAGVALGNIAYLIYRARIQRETSKWFLAVRNAVAVALVAHCFSPILLAPCVALLITSSTLFSAVHKTARSVVGLVLFMLAGVFVPWIGELAGWWAPTISHTSDAVCLVSPVVGVPGWIRYAGVAFFIAFAIAASASLAHTMHNAARKVRAQLELQAWQLRQLMA